MTNSFFFHGEVLVRIFNDYEYDDESDDALLDIMLILHVMEIR